MEYRLSGSRILIRNKHCATTKNFYLERDAKRTCAVISILDRFVEQSRTALDSAGKPPQYRHYLLRELLGVPATDRLKLEALTLDEWQELDERAISEDQLQLAAAWIFSSCDQSPVRRGTLLLQDFSPTEEQLKRCGCDLRERVRAIWRNGRAIGFEEGVQTGREMERRAFTANVRYLRLCERLTPYASIREAQEALDAKDRSIALKLEQLEKREQRLQDREESLEHHDHHEKTHTYTTNHQQREDNGHNDCTAR